MEQLYQRIHNGVVWKVFLKFYFGLYLSY